MSSDTLPLNSRIYVAGHRGMVGSAILRRLQSEGYRNLLTRSHAELELTDQRVVADFFSRERPEVVFLSAAKVGGIQANNRYRADFIYRNLMIECNVIHAAFTSSTERLLFLGSSCIYPRSCPQPMREEHLLTGPPEPTNEPYAVAKIAGLKLCESYNRQHGTRFRAVMPTNLYGPGDNFDLEGSHVLPAMIRKVHLAKLAMHGDWEAVRKDEERFGPIPEDVRESWPNVALWGSGSPRREFLHVDDMASACVFVMQLSDAEYAHACGGDSISHLNVGCGVDHTIRELADMIAWTAGFKGRIVWDSTRPDGMARKLLDVSRLSRLGFSPAVGLADGIASVYGWYLLHSRSTVEP